MTRSASRYRRARDVPFALQRLTERLRVARRAPLVCRMCGGSLGRAQALVRDGRVRLEGFEETARVRWTAEDELAFEHVRPGDCERG